MATNLRVLFMGRKQSGAQALEWTIAQGFQVVGVLTDSHLPGSPTAAVAAKNNLPLLTLEEANQKVRDQELEFDLAVSFVFWRKIREPLLSYPRLGVINFHPSPLPDYKGFAGYNLAILRDLPEWAVTAHYMDASFDTGGIIEVARFPIDRESETAFSLERETQQQLLKLYQKTMLNLKPESLLPTIPNVGGRYITKEEMEDMKEVREGDDLDRKVRAFWFPPYHGAFVRRGGKKYTLVSDAILAQLAPAGATYLPPVERK